VYRYPMLHAETLRDEASIGPRIDECSGISISDRNVKAYTRFRGFHYSGGQVQLCGISLGHSYGRAGLH
jgi:hypothetical protein